MALPTEAISRSLRELQKRRKQRIRLVVAGAGGLLPVLQSIWPPDGWLHEAIEYLGIALLVACILGRAWCTLYIGGRKAHELVEMGPYSLSRNPLYFFSFIGVLGAGFQSGSLTVGIVFLMISIAIFLPVIKHEERALEKIFGPAFQSYKTRVPRFWPRFSSWREAENLSISTRLLYITLRDGLVFACVIPLFEVIDWLQGLNLLPIVARLP